MYTRDDFEKNPHAVWKSFSKACDAEYLAREAYCKSLIALVLSIGLNIGMIVAIIVLKL